MQRCLNSLSITLFPLIYFTSALGHQKLLPMASNTL